ncbi:MAG: hypothetical protein R2854_31325 [Caldilineaceae bacterium]
MLREPCCYANLTNGCRAPDAKRRAHSGDTAAAGHQNDAPCAADVDALLRWYELHLLSVTGFQPQLFHRLDCAA